jgi:ABC-2 type transport system permease protein
MTAITTSSSTAAPNAGVAAPHASQGSGSGASFATATAQSARRTILQFLRTPQLIVLPTIMGALFLFVFRYIFGGAIETGSGIDYVDFLVPGFLLTTIMWTGMNAPAGVAEDAASGVHDRFRSLPIPRAAVVAGRSLADGALVSWALLVTSALGFAVGFRTHADIAAVAGAFALMLVANYAFTWVFVSLGLLAGNAQAAQGMSTLLVVPLTFLSSAYVPVASMPGWMQPVAANQPVTAMVNAVRSLMLGGADAAGIGHSTAYWVALSLVWSAGILAVFCGFAVARFGRTR